MMKFNDLSTKWDAIQPGEGTFQRVEVDHILDIYIGKNSSNKRALLILSSTEPDNIVESKAIEIRKNLREDGQWATSFSLVDENKDHVFVRLCWDLIESARRAPTNDKAIEVVMRRYLEWQKLMLNGNDLLSDEVIKGIIGELIYARDFLSVERKWEHVISAWLGPQARDKDFVFEDTWTEVKTIRRGKESVTISSLEQLSSEVDGLLAVMLIDKTSNTDTSGFSFNGLISSVRTEIESNPQVLLEFERKLISLGYVERKEYDEMFYSFAGARFFDVNQEFPKIEASSIPREIIKAKYDIDLVGLANFER